MAKRVKYRGRIPSYQCLIWSVSSALVGDILVQPDFLRPLSNGIKSLKMFHNKFMVSITICKWLWLAPSLALKVFMFMTRVVDYCCRNESSLCNAVVLELPTAFLLCNSFFSGLGSGESSETHPSKVLDTYACVAVEGFTTQDTPGKKSEVFYSFWVKNISTWSHYAFFFIRSHDCTMLQISSSGVVFANISRKDNTSRNHTLCVPVYVSILGHHDSEEAWA